MKAKTALDRAILKARDSIENAMDQNGPYTHNIISLSLRSLAEKGGNKAANDLVDEYELDQEYGIQKVEEK